MIVFNTTFHVEEEIHEEFIAYMQQHFIPLSTKSGLLSSPRLSRVFGKEEDEGFSFAMEFLAADLAALEQWKNEESGAVFASLLEKFKEKLAGFTTIMQTVEKVKS